ncbi:MAG: inositol monophosphatase [Phaeodactylibacter sp.]|nr:inositol monophosphatase [Phaeodactylibacter sp.]
MNLEKICHQTIPIIERSGRFIRQELGRVSSGDIEEKALNSLVSYVDKTAEEQLVEGLGELLPGSVFLTEEDTIENRSGDLQWIIDPLDGTTNFLFQLPVFSISVALQQEGQTVLGIVYEINRQECFYAWRGAGAFLNGQPIRVSRRAPLEQALLATGFPYHDYSRMREYFQVFEHFMRHSRGLRRFGSAAVDLAYVACGRFDGFFEYGLNAWDVAGGAFIIREAGGVVTDFKGGGDFLYGGEIVAANPAVGKEMLGVIRGVFGYGN